MNKKLTHGLTLILGVAMAGSVGASGIYTVNPDGSGDFTRLQTAINTVPSGSTLLVTGIHDPVVIQRKSLAILGGTIRWDNYLDPHSSAIEATGCEWLVLQDVVAGRGSDPFDVANGPGADALRASNIGTLLIERCALLATNYVPEMGGDCNVGDAYVHHAVIVDGVRSVHMKSSTCFGADGKNVWAFEDDKCDPCDDTVYGGRGGDGIVVKNSLVHAEGVQFVGGDGGFVNWNVQFDGCDAPPTWIQGGDGGHGMTGVVYGAQVVALKGEGGKYYYGKTDWGIGAEGNDGLDVNGSFVEIPNRISLTTFAEPGGTVDLLGFGFEPTALAVVLGSFELASPVRLHDGLWFLLPPIFPLAATSTDATGAFAMHAMLPDHPLLSGLQFYVQVADSYTLSEPETMVIGCEVSL